VSVNTNIKQKMVSSIYLIPGWLKAVCRMHVLLSDALALTPHKLVQHLGCTHLYTRKVVSSQCRQINMWKGTQVPILIRPPSNAFIAIRNPCPSCPIRLRRGMRQFSKMTAEVGCEFHPNYFSVIGYLWLYWELLKNSFRLVTFLSCLPK